MAKRPKRSGSVRRAPRKAKPVKRPAKTRAKKTPAKTLTAAAKPLTTTELIAAKTAASQQLFLERFVMAGNVAGAARASGIHRDTHYEWVKTDAKYAAAFDIAKLDARDVMETEMRRRALVGENEPVFYMGKIVGHINRKSDALLMFGLRGLFPEVYGRRVEHSGPNGGPIQVAATISAVPLHELSDAELEVAERLRARFDAGMALATPAEPAPQHAS